MVLIVKAETAPLRIDANGVARIGATRVTLDTVIAAYLPSKTMVAILFCKSGFFAPVGRSDITPLN